MPFDPNWVTQGNQEGASHLIVVCDTFSYEDYPVFVKPEEDLEEKKKKYNGVNMQKIMEVIKLDAEPLPKQPKKLPEAKQIWKYNKTGSLYVVLQLCMVKTRKPNTENGWSKSVMYCAASELVGQRNPLQTSDYVSELEEFENLFTLVAEAPKDVQ
jgi:hypothetical protein